MKKLTTVFAALVALFAVSNAQIVQPSDPGTSFEWKQTTDGSSLLAMSAFTLHEAYFALPFGLDFYAGHDVWLGTRTRLSNPMDAQGVFGYEVYARKDIGSINGADFYVKGFVGLCLGPRTEDSKALTGYLGMSAGVKF